MAHSFGSLVFTSAVKALQERYGSRQQYARLEQQGQTQDTLGEQETEFITERDSFYMATIGSSGWPYIQHRGGPKGFVKVFDGKVLAFADFRGNKQYVSTGNLTTDARVAIILVDYPNRARLKLLGTAQVLDEDKAEGWLERVRVRDYKAVIERVFLIQVAAFDWNCPQHITPRYTTEEIREALAPTEARVTELEQENAMLRKRLADRQR